MNSNGNAEFQQSYLGILFEKDQSEGYVNFSRMISELEAASREGESQE